MFVFLICKFTCKKEDYLNAPPPKKKKNQKSYKFYQMRGYDRLLPT